MPQKEERPCETPDATTAPMCTLGFVVLRVFVVCVCGQWYDLCGLWCVSEFRVTSRGGGGGSWCGLGCVGGGVWMRDRPSNHHHHHIQNTSSTEPQPLIVDVPWAPPSPRAGRRRR